MRDNTDLLKTIGRPVAFLSFRRWSRLDKSDSGEHCKRGTAGKIFAGWRSRRGRIPLQPSLCRSRPWTTFENYLRLGGNNSAIGMIGAVAPIQGDRAVVRRFRGAGY